ncbi:uncharacterized protein LOC143363737 [Halictus rubicundus]|uniref:uncharacterized protein LOC143363737 n=1 Tax=Halictus rubicundus TaxID=77578 RepID=UPI0040373361
MGDLKTLLKHQIDAARIVERTLDNFKKIGKAKLTVATVKNRIARLSESFAECQRLHKQLSAVATDAERSTVGYFTQDRFMAVHEIYMETSDYMAETLSRLAAADSSGTDSTPSPAGPVSQPDDDKSRMPMLNLPTFSGAFSEWETFRDRFTAMVISRKGLSNVSRFEYLLACLQGAASDLVENIAITDAGFAIAWDLLVECFENKRLLVTTHLETLYDLPQVHSESADQLRSLRDKANKAIKALQNLDRPVEHWGDLLVFFVTTKLDSESRKAWELKLGDNTDCPTFETLNTFLKSRIRALQTIKPSPSGAASRIADSAATKSSRVRATSLHGAAAVKSPCELCKANHILGQCALFKSKSVEQRVEFAKGTNRCMNCLSPYHSTKKCTSSYNCSICKRRHHTLLHLNNATASSTGTASSNNSTLTTENVTSLLTSCSVPRVTATQQVLLATAWVELRSPSGRSEKIRALLDQGSVISIIAENLTQRLRLPRSRVSVSITGIGNNAVACRSSTTFTVASCKTDSVYSMSAYVLRSLSNYLPHQVSTGVRLSHIRDLELADDNPFDSAPIELIIGADQYGLLLLEGLRKGPVNEPTAQNTTLGWILSGPVPSFASNAPTSVASFHCNVSGNLDAELRRFWEVEELPFVTRLSPAEQKCEEHFQRTHTRAPNGQYIVRLPFIEGPPIDIGPSLSAANTMFLRQENRLQRNAEHSAEYAQFLREYEALGHMAEVTDTQTVPSLQTVYIPHHAVIREHSATTRLRVVFNASSKTGNGTSLNDHLLIGPKLQTDLAAVILRWRRYRYVFIADIAKMYRQILVDHKDVDYQRILWRSSPSEPLRHYRLLTVTYGTGPAPYLALRVLQQLAKDEGSKYPLAQLVLRDQIYVDDCVFGADDPRLARKTRDHVTALLQEGGFKLRKWASNCPALIADIDPSDHGLAASKPLLPDDNLKVLGINWNPGNDSFRFDIGIQNVIPATKREILSTIARFYDPLGWAAPVVIVAKILMQRLWLQKCDWDETIPTEFRETWTTYCTQLPLLRSIVLPRWTGHGLNVLKTELHGFADASQNAYAAVVYSRVTTNNGEILVSLLAAKSKVAPLKSFTIPRLELCGVVLLSRLMSFIRTSFEDSACEMHGWTDSTITLAWISQPASRWKTFVANRVANIQELVPKCQWHHVISEDNPADCASRGIHVPQFVNHSLWWHGPRWLKSPSTSWPCETTPLKATTEERIPVALHAVTVPEPWDLATRFSSWPKLLRVTAYILRFIKRLQSYRNLSESSTSATEGHSENCPNPSALLPIEIRQARTYWLKHIQQTVLPVEFQRLYGKHPLPRQSPVLSLNPYLDSEGLIRVGGRLQNSALPEETKHPIILASHPLVSLLISHLHRSLLHAGPQLTLAKLRQEFWLLRARPTVRQVLYKCVICARQRATIPFELMGELPAVRVTRSERAFLHCGVDYAGPIAVRTTPGRGHKSTKAYIALFICMATRAVHLEFVGSYTTDAFLACYDRFISRRGLPVAMYSDNGTTFQGADKELTTAFRSATRDPNLLNKLASDQVAWHFIPPSAPHFGGLWEAGFRSMKHHFKRVIGSHTLTFEEMTTVLCQIEACMNSRPIAPRSENIDDYTALTPGHFLIGTAITTVPTVTLLDVNDSRLTRWQLLKKLYESVWKAWSNDYIHSLQQRTKWRTASHLAKVGRIVLLRNALAPPCKWELARIIKCHPGEDNIIRVVTIKTANSEYKRPIVKLCFLPVDINETDTLDAKNADETQPQNKQPLRHGGRS